MTDLVPQETAITHPGDFMGAEDEEHLYHMLGLEYGAPEEEVRDAARELMGRYHPDNGGNEAAYKTIGKVRDTLLGETQESEFADLEEFKQLKNAEEFFSYQEIREDIVDIREIAKDRFKKEKGEKKFERAVEEREQDSDENYRVRYQVLERQRKEANSLEQIVEAEVAWQRFTAELFGREIDDEETLRESIEEKLEQQRNEREERLENNVSAKGGVYASSEKYYSLAEKELTDIVVQGDITFVEDKKDQEFAVADIEREGEIVRAKFVGDRNRLKRDNPVHCKVPEGEVTVEDTGLRGTIQVLEGSVELDIESSGSHAEAPVVRAKAPNVDVESGYKEHGDIYIPENRDDTEPIEEEIDLDIAVMDGEIRLNDQQDSDLADIVEGMVTNKEMKRIEAYLKMKEDKAIDNYT